MYMLVSPTLQVNRCCTIMGRKEGEELTAAQIFYPSMQCADIFFLKADICQLGMDQRKVNMLAREYCDLAEPKIKFKPVILSHRMYAQRGIHICLVTHSHGNELCSATASVRLVARHMHLLGCPGCRYACWLERGSGEDVQVGSG